MGLISHEAPRLTSHGPIPYSAHDADRPLESGMVISIETTIAHPRRGFIKLEDTVAVTRCGLGSFRRSRPGLEPSRRRLPVTVWTDLLLDEAGPNEAARAAIGRSVAAFRGMLWFGARSEP